MGLSYAGAQVPVLMVPVLMELASQGPAFEELVLKVQHRHHELGSLKSLMKMVEIFGEMVVILEEMVGISEEMAGILEGREQQFLLVIVLGFLKAGLFSLVRLLLKSHEIYLH